jgi:hypothetical protein
MSVSDMIQKEECVQNLKEVFRRLHIALLFSASWCKDVNLSEAIFLKNTQPIYRQLLF